MSLDSTGPGAEVASGPAPAPVAPSAPAAPAPASHPSNAAADLPAPSHVTQEPEARSAEEALIKGTPLTKGAQPLGSRPRNPDGTFVAAPKPVAPGTPSEASPTGEPLAPAQKAPAPAEKPVNFGGRVFKTLGEAEADYRALLSRVPAEQRRNAQLMQHAAKQQEIIEKLKEIIQGKAKPEAPPPGTPAPGAQTAEPEDGILVDPQSLELLASKIGLPATLAYLQEKLTGHLTTKLTKLQEAFDARLKEELQPYHQFQTDQSFIAKGQSLFQRAAAAVTPEGAAIFPEMRDMGAAREIGEIWMDLEPSLRDSEDGRGLFAAISMYRTMRQLHGGSPAAAAPGGAKSSAEVALDAAVAAAPTTLESGAPVAPTLPRAGNPQNDLLRAMVTKNRSQIGDINLGFDVGS